MPIIQACLLKSNDCARFYILRKVQSCKGPKKSVRKNHFGESYTQCLWARAWRRYGSTSKLGSVPVGRFLWYSSMYQGKRY
jgi:hypothetical protein